ncbi:MULTISPECIES: glycine cleavage system aminomethyltransferase GcvT [unclassified Mesorhizobium]|uniref:glycine cleavage system aminomethyltransferase GcvT n=1 Tax=unclassified Mesorhizobium TaxID=325217 RepID=UPI0003D01D22|nr:MULTISPECIES: glycine cleavage system aminomethyltransferase GcvT [unclassified Mesorhizobium]ESZ62233.1 glycine cleavage system protein T [Mesorhizobium sp. L103C120A0]WJI42248.1 glycine cleavage system aminomethyltransferase GcvT [Mesorhizobium sp. C120A]
MTGDDTKHLPLEDLHTAAGARFGAFAGWSMPLTFPAGVMKEHLHTREHAGLFDISHMKLFEISGPGAAALLNRASPLDAGALEISQSKYTFFLNEAAGIIDDLIVTRLGAERFMVVANAGNAVEDEKHLRALATDFDVKVDALDRVFLAIQGPEAWAALSRAGIETGSLLFMHGIEPKQNWFMSRSGYTGEDGFEIGLPEADARALATKLIEDERVLWIGLAARDSLRLEAGLCLHGQDITPEIDPASAGLMWAIPKDLRAGGSFIGADALRSILERGPSQKRVGLKPDGRQPVRAGAALFDADGDPAGYVTSGGFGPSAGHPVAMGYVSTALAKPGTKLFADVRGTKIPVDISSLPFTPHRYRKG